MSRRACAPRFTFWRTSKTGVIQMIDVACFCGTSFSFDGDLGACPKCGEVVNPAGAFPGAERHTLEELDKLALGPEAEVAAAPAARALV
jgi:hypothetical protein